MCASPAEQLAHGILEASCNSISGTETELLRGSQLQARAAFGGFGHELCHSPHHLHLMDKASSAWVYGHLVSSSAYTAALGDPPPKFLARCLHEIMGLHFKGCWRCTTHMRPRGPMDKASAYGAGDCRFESCRGHFVRGTLRA